jgi:hypothetical protein
MQQKKNSDRQVRQERQGEFVTAEVAEDHAGKNRQMNSSALLRVLSGEIFLLGVLGALGGSIDFSAL